MIPNRVIVDYHGQAVPCEIAEKRYYITYDIAFKRKDGWILGASEEHEDIAYEMWKDEWVAYYRRIDGEWMEIKYYE